MHVQKNPRQLASGWHPRLAQACNKAHIPDSSFQYVFSGLVKQHQACSKTYNVRSTTPFFISYTFAWYNFCDHPERPISLSLFLCMSLPGELLLLESFKHIIDSLNLRTWSTHIAHTYSTQIARTWHVQTTHTYDTYSTART